MTPSVDDKDVFPAPVDNPRNFDVAMQLLTDHEMLLSLVAPVEGSWTVQAVTLLHFEDSPSLIGLLYSATRAMERAGWDADWERIVDQGVCLYVETEWTDRGEVIEE